MSEVPAELPDQRSPVHKGLAQGLWQGVRRMGVMKSPQGLTGRSGGAEEGQGWSRGCSGAAELRGGDMGRLLWGREQHNEGV